jgi:hypothetical protein
MGTLSLDGMERGPPGQPYPMIFVVGRSVNASGARNRKPGAFPAHITWEADFSALRALAGLGILVKQLEQFLERDSWTF